MTDSVAQHAGLPHAVFLHRLAGESPSSALEPRLGRAAFVALRLVDLLGPEYTTLHPDAFHYQYVATARCCRDLPPGATESSHLVGLVHGTHDAFEQGSRIGRADTLRGRGNLLEAEGYLGGILADAERAGDVDAGARAHQVMAVVLGTRGQPADAIPHLWRAFELFQDDISRTRALADLGSVLVIVGDTQGAERALLEVLWRGNAGEGGSHARVRLVKRASSPRDPG